MDQCAIDQDCRPAEKVCCSVFKPIAYAQCIQNDEAFKIATQNEKFCSNAQVCLL